MTSVPLEATVSPKAAVFDPGGRFLVVHHVRGERWEFPGGRVDVGERPVEALRRELREETGLAPTIGWPVDADAWINDDDQGRFVVVFRAWTDDPTVDLGADHDEFAWIAPERAGEYFEHDTAVRAVERAAGTRERPTGPFD